MDEAGSWAPIDDLLGPVLRADLEDRLWRPIGTGASLEAVIHDPAFLADPGRHPAMFADHGVVHARDVAAGVLRLLGVVDGGLQPGRPIDRRRFMEALGVATAYVHDVGMVDLTHAGRRLHAIVAAHAAFGPEVDPLVEHLWSSGGVVRDRLAAVAAAAPFAVPAEVVVRELLSLSVLHSKSVVPAALFDDRAGLRRLLQRIVFTPLEAHRAAGRPPGPDDGEPIVPGPGAAHPGAPDAAYAWLAAPGGPQAGLADDALDAMRVLRAADVLRQRGTVLRTSGGFEVCMDAGSARAVCTLRPASGDAAYVVTYDDPRAAGEANVAEALLTARGDLRIAVHRGAFGTPEADRLAVASVAAVVVDIVADVLPSIAGTTVGDGLTPPAHPVTGIRIQLERPSDRPAFAAELAAAVAGLDPALAPRLETVADTFAADAAERARYLRGEPLAPTDETGSVLLCRMAERGARVDGLDPARAFAEVVRACVAAGERLVALGSRPAFVYVPTGDGLVVRPDGGYAPAPLAAWVPVGTTGVIRGAERNGDIVAEREVEVVIIPGDRYVRDWLRPLTVAELVARLGGSRAR
jgi:hypothetical protein